MWDDCLMEHPREAVLGGFSCGRAMDRGGFLGGQPAHAVGGIAQRRTSLCFTYDITGRGERSASDCMLAIGVGETCIRQRFNPRIKPRGQIVNSR